MKIESRPGGKDIEAWQLARELTRKVYRLTKKSGFAKDYGLKRQIQETFQVHSSMPALARVDMHSWHYLNECYAKRFYPMGQGSQVWARGSSLPWCDITCALKRFF